MLKVLVKERFKSISLPVSAFLTTQIKNHVLTANSRRRFVPADQVFSCRLLFNLSAQNRYFYTSDISWYLHLWQGLFQVHHDSLARLSSSPFFRVSTDERTDTHKNLILSTELIQYHIGHCKEIEIEKLTFWALALLKSDLTEIDWSSPLWLKYVAVEPDWAPSNFTAFSTLPTYPGSSWLNDKLSLIANTGKVYIDFLTHSGNEPVYKINNNQQEPQ